jgi:hypothetical protein
MLVSISDCFAGESEFATLRTADTASGRTRIGNPEARNALAHDISCYLSRIRLQRTDDKAKGSGILANN